jgi:cholesterol transport system auxiliary component
MNMIMKQLLVLVMMLTVSACSVLSPAKLGPDNGYVINSVPDHVVKSGRHSRTLLVMRPDTDPVYNTTRIAFTMQPYQISYYAVSHWIETPADMLTPLLVATMLKTNRFKTVIAPPFIGQYDYALRTQIKTMLIDYTQRLPVMRINIQAQLIGASSGRVLSSREFSTAVPLYQKSPYGAVVAANHGTSRLLAEIARWCVKRA